MSKTVFSVIVCVYNGEKYLEQCLDSIVNQTFMNIEIIVVDDGSTDRTSEICEAFAAWDDRICILHQKNSGKSIAIKQGIQKAIGTYFSIVDSDDWIDQDYFDCLKKYAEEKIDMVVQSFIIEPSHQMIRTNYSIKNKCVTGLELINSNNVIHTANDACFSWRILFRREFVIDNNLYPHPQIVIGEDTEMNLRALKSAGQVICTDYAGYHYRSDNQGSLMRRQYLSTYERDLELQFATRNAVSLSKSYRYNMARYYVETILYRVLDNAGNTLDGLKYSDIKRIFHYDWLIESYQILGNSLRMVICNRNAYFINLLVKYRFCMLYYILNKMG